MAQYNLGVMLATGEGAAQNQSEAVQWFRRAAAKGDEQAQFGLATMLANGEGVAQNQSEAMQWFRRAAEQGEVKAQYNLSVMLANGEGVAQNFAQAYIWMSLAAAQNGEYRKARDFIAKQLTPAQIQSAQAKASEWKPKPEH